MSDGLSYEPGVGWVSPFNDAEYANKYTWVYTTMDHERRDKIASGQIILGGPPYWFKELRWSNEAWEALRAC